MSKTDAEGQTTEDGADRPRIGFIGLGIMGRSMVRNLMKAGYAVTVYNRSSGAVEQLASEGALPAASPREVTAVSDVMITMVTDSPDVVEVVLGERGIIETVRPGMTVIDMSTISPKVAQDVATALAEKDVRMLDAPVSGGDKGAKDGTLSIMVGGEEEVFREALPILQVMGRQVVHVGGSGMGQTVKLVNQIIGGINLLAVAEGLAFAASAGADIDKTLQVVTKGAAGSWALEHLGAKMATGDYAPGFMVRLQQKDLRLALDAADELHLPLPGLALVHQMLRYMKGIGAENEGTQALIKVYEALGAQSAATPR